MGGDHDTTRYRKCHPQCGEILRKPRHSTQETIEKLLQYVVRTANLGITYSGKDNGIKMLAYANSDYATCLDTRCSVSSGAILLGGGVISWYSRIQGITTSATSEYVALVETVKETLFLRQVEIFIMPTLESYTIKIWRTNRGP